MVHYSLSFNHGFNFATADIISIGISKETIDYFTDTELIELTADCLEHEHVHRVIYKLFGNTPCKLFDAIEHHLRNEGLHRKYVEIENLLDGTTPADGKETYHDFIDRAGFEEFREYYNITPDDMIKAGIRCNYRRLNNE